ncbi:hypothetical protein ASL20_02580 [Cupriavidus necator]|nr:hypothetical protein ASL20_02580 [Cupriavidus necator]
MIGSAAMSWHRAARRHGAHRCGREYLAEIAPLLRQMERATMNVMALKGRGGALSLSVGASLGSYWLIPRLPAFTRAHGEITLNLRTRVGPVDFSTASVDASQQHEAGVAERS